MARSCELQYGHQCLWEHIKVKTRAAGLKPQEVTGKASISLCCPGHPDHKRSLSISAAASQGKRLVWNCHAGCPEMAVREALIRKARISPGCLPVSARDAADLLERVVSELTRPGAKQAQKVLRALSAGLGYKEIPRGEGLDRLAALASVGRRSAYRALGAYPDNE